MAIAETPTDVRTFRILVSDPISDRGVERLRSADGVDVDVRPGLAPEALLECIGAYDALIVRSGTRVTPDVIEAGTRLRAIGRAGSGVDNIHLESATARGIVVMNTPGGNSVAAAEQTVALMTALARNVAPANRDLVVDGKWNRKLYTGIELAGKSIGVVGLGRIGREVARRASGLQMRVLGYDPYVGEDVCTALGIERLDLDALYAASDVVSLHLPLTPSTRGMIDADALAKFKPGARLINCARGPLIDEAALLEALEQGRLAGAGLDVFETEPPEDLTLVRHPKVVATPHLGASTVEAQERVGTEICDKVLDYLETGAILDAVNFPAIGREAYAEVRPVMHLADRLGRFLFQYAEGARDRLEIDVQGRFLELPSKPIAMAAAQGALSTALADGVSLLNALSKATEQGWTIEDRRSNTPSRFAGLLRLTLAGADGSTTVAGTLFDGGQARLVEIDGVPIESAAEGTMLCSRNKDVPGVVGRIGSHLGEARVNIAGLQLGTISGTDEALAILNVDRLPDDETLDAIRAIPEMLSVRTIVL
ncbi:MAG: phosphoglycerate dehydrogenase [Planctomycetota bacterium]|nr:phosphoglycerate dehydrogenase [Planctomycetota bacterium]